MKTEYKDVKRYDYEIFAVKPLPPFVKLSENLVIATSNIANFSIDHEKNLPTLTVTCKDGQTFLCRLMGHLKEEFAVALADYLELDWRQYVK